MSETVDEPAAPDPPETHDAAPSRTTVTEALEAYYTENGVAFGAGDLLCMGGGAPALRLAPLLSILLAMRREGGAAAFSRVQVVVGPGEDLAIHTDDLIDAIDQDVAARRGAPLSERELEVTRRRLHVTAASNAQHSSVITAIRAAAPQSAVIVEVAAGYRSNDVAPYIPDGSEGPTLQEDFWAPQLHALTRAAIDVAKQAPCYVVLDAGENSPNRRVLRELLESVDGCGVLGGGYPGDPLQIIAPFVDAWIATLKAGRIGTVLREIDALSDLGEENKIHVKVQMLHRAGLAGQAVEMLTTLTENLVGVDPHGLVKLAEIAAEGSAYALAKRLLEAAREKLTSQEALQLALAVASRVDSESIENDLAARLMARFPDAPVLRERQLQAMLAGRDFARAATVATELGQQDDAQFYDALRDTFGVLGVPDYSALISAWSTRGSDWGGRARIACVNDAVARRLPVHAHSIALELSHSGFRPRTAARLLIDAIELILVSRADTDQLAVSLADVKAAIQTVVDYLAANPDDGHARVGVAQALSIETSGMLGQACVASALVDLAQRPIAQLPSPPRGGARMEWLLERRTFLDNAFSWLASESPVVLGKATFPDALLTENADEVVAAIVDVVQESGNRDDDADVLQRFATLGAAIAPHTSDPSQAIGLLRLAASKLATMGQRQQARDFAEAIMAMANTPNSARQAWFAMADIYHRAGNPIESLVAMCCALSASDAADPEQLWYETTTIIRLLRDLGLVSQALSVIERARPQFDRLGFLATNGHRLDLMEIQTRFIDISRDSERMRADVEPLLSQAVVNAETVLKLGDDPTPIGVVLAQVMRSAVSHRLPVPQAATDAYERLLARAPQSTKIMMRTFLAPAPLPSDVMEIVAATQQARYAEDAGFDAQRATMAASRLLGSAQADDPVVAAFAIELLSDRGVAAPGWDAAATPPKQIASIEDPAGIARDIAREGVAVALAGFDEDGRFVRLLVSKDGLSKPERDSSFSLHGLEAWSAQHLPYRYGVDESDPNLFFNSTEGLKLDILPATPVVVVADSRLQQFPPHLYREGDRFAGAGRPIAATPSLSWLRASRAKPPQGIETRAWISTADSDGQTLAMVADRLGPVLDQHTIPLVTTPVIPENLAGSRLAIIAAHGQVLPEGKFFQLVADDGDLSVSASEFARALRNVGVVVLFVCSGGRADKHPASNTTVGLAKQLLDRGCSAVIASPWPLDARVPYHWLPPFLAAWNGGSRVIDCVFAANRAVDRAFPHDPARSLALHLYGDPLVQSAAPTDA